MNYARPPYAAVRLLSAALLAALSVAIGHAQTPAPLATTADRTSFSALGDEVVDRVRTEFYDAGRGEAWALENRGYAREIRDAATFSRETNARLDRLGASHTRYYGRDDPGFAEISSIFAGVGPGPSKIEVDSLGLGLARFAEGWFVVRPFAGSTAEGSGLQRGDRIATLDGQPFDPVLSTRGKAGRKVVLGVERHRGEALLELTLTPAKVDPSLEWLAGIEHGSRIVERAGRKIGYVPVWSCAGERVLQEITEQVGGGLADADALVLDLRGGWGGCSPQLVQFFVPVPPFMVSTDRDGKALRYPPAWEKPLVLLIDGGSRSGKEVVARALQKLHRATLVGERTGGAVLAGRYIPLQDGSVLYLAVFDIKVDGERLEGVGVAPEVAIASELRWAAGGDPQLDGALDRAAALATGPSKP